MTSQSQFNAVRFVSGDPIHRKHCYPFLEREASLRNQKFTESDFHALQHAISKKQLEAFFVLAGDEIVAAAIYSPTIYAEISGKKFKFIPAYNLELVPVHSEISSEHIYGNVGESLRTSYNEAAGLLVHPITASHIIGSFSHRDALAFAAGFNGTVFGPGDPVLTFNAPNIPTAKKAEQPSTQTYNLAIQTSHQPSVYQAADKAFVVCYTQGATRILSLVTRVTPGWRDAYFNAQIISIGRLPKKDTLLDALASLLKKTSQEIRSRNRSDLRNSPLNLQVSSFGGPVIHEALIKCGANVLEAAQEPHAIKFANIFPQRGAKEPSVILYGHQP